MKKETKKHIVITGKIAPNALERFSINLNKKMSRQELDQWALDAAKAIADAAWKFSP